MEKRFGVVSADGHCRLMHLPFDLWTKRLPRKFQDDGPRVVRGPDGIRQWIVEGHNWSGVGWAGVGRGPVNCYTREVWRRSRSPASSARQTPSIAAGTWTATRSMPSSSTAPMRAAQPVADEGRQLPDGAHGGTDERRRFSGICDRHPGVRFVLGRARPHPGSKARNGPSIGAFANLHHR